MNDAIEIWWDSLYLCCRGNMATCHVYYYDDDDKKKQSLDVVWSPLSSHFLKKADPGRRRRMEIFERSKKGDEEKRERLHSWVLSFLPCCTVGHRSSHTDFEKNGGKRKGLVCLHRESIRKGIFRNFKTFLYEFLIKKKVNCIKVTDDSTTHANNRIKKLDVSYEYALYVLYSCILRHSLWPKPCNLVGLVS